MDKEILLLLLVIVSSSLSSDASSIKVPIYATLSAKHYALGFQNQNCLVRVESPELPHFVAVTEADEHWLQIALDMLQNNKCEYVALLFYAWCPFSRSFRPVFDLISSLYSSIPHFAIKESSLKPSTLSKYGVHGFPTILLLNSTMRVRYRGTRMIDSLVDFYSNVTGIESLDKTFLEKRISVPHPGNSNNTEPENCPFTWARSPENMLCQETYLVLAIVFVFLRSLHLFFPSLIVFTKSTWRRIAQNMRFDSLLEHTIGFLSRVVHLCMYLKEPCKRSNLQGGAMNARAWASKSLATVSIGDSSSSNRRSSASQ